MVMSVTLPYLDPCVLVFPPSPSHAHLLEWHWKLPYNRHYTLPPEQLYLQMFRVVSLVQILFQIFCCCPESWSSCGYGSLGLAPSLLQQLTDGVDVRVDQLGVLDLALGGS